MSQTDMLACPVGECRDSERSEPAQTPDTALRINHFQERKAERMRQERNRGSRLNRHPKHPDYKVYNREISGQYRGPQVICRTANFPRRARRGA